jgi:hypothetical protein
VFQKCLQNSIQRQAALYHFYTIICPPHQPRIFLQWNTCLHGFPSVYKVSNRCIKIVYELSYSKMCFQISSIDIPSTSRIVFFHARFCQHLPSTPRLTAQRCSTFFFVATHLKNYVRTPLDGNTKILIGYIINIYNIQSIHKRMVRFQKWITNWCLILQGHNIHRQRRQLSKFLMRYQQFASYAYCVAAGPVSKNACTAGHYSGHATPGLGWLWLPCGCVSCDPGCTHWSIVITKWETWTVAAADGVCWARVRWEIKFLFTFETAPFFCVCPV